MLFGVGTSGYVHFPTTWMIRSEGKMRDPHYARVAAVKKQCTSSEALPFLDGVTAELRCALTAASAPETTKFSAIDALDSIRTGPATEALNLAAFSSVRPV